MPFSQLCRISLPWRTVRVGEACVFDEEALWGYAQFMTGPALAKVDVRPNHMSTNLSLVVVADRVIDEAARSLRRFRFRKSFRFGLRGVGRCSLGRHRPFPYRRQSRFDECGGEGASGSARSERVHGDLRNTRL